MDVNQKLTVFGTFLILLLPAGGQTEYTGDGVPTARGEEIRWLLNRGRFNPAAENNLRGTAYSGLSAKGPYAPNALLANAARNHSEDLARKNTTGHTTVTGSLFYDWARHQTNGINDSIDRAVDEGYTPYESVGENLAYANTTGAAAYLQWWNSAGHRNIMYDVSIVKREIGVGYFQLAGTTNVHYDSMVVGRQGTATGFFTDTVFRDADSNGTYGGNEGISGIRVELANNGAAHSWFDTSSASGSFAVPLTGIAAGTPLQVYLTNPTGGAVTLSIPSDFSTFRTLTLPAGQRWLLGTFTRATNTNAGFRGMAFNNAVPVAAPPVTISTATGQAVISWPSQTGLTYQVQWSENLITWANLHSPALAGTGAAMSVTDPSTTTAAPRRFYKVVVTGP